MYFLSNQYEGTIGFIEIRLWQGKGAGLSFFSHFTVNTGPVVLDNMASLLDSHEQQYGIITASITAKTAKLSSAAFGMIVFSFFF